MDYSGSLDLVNDHCITRQWTHGVGNGGADKGGVGLERGKGSVGFDRGKERVDGDDGLVELRPHRSSRIPVPKKAFSSLSIADGTTLPEPVLADFISLLVSSDAIFSPVDCESLLSLEESILEEHLMPTAFLSSVSSPTKWNLKKEPQSYAEACTCPDAAAW